MILKTITTTITILSLSLIPTKINATELEDKISSLRSLNTNSKVDAKINLYIKAIKKHFLYASPRLSNLTKSNKGTSFDILWSIDKKALSGRLPLLLPLYKGPAPEVTDSKFGNSNNLYFYNKPLGTTYGLTLKGDDSDFFEVIKDIKLFIIATHKNTQIHIPLISSNSKEGCEFDIFNNNKEILCIQTSSTTSNFSIGSNAGYSNNITFPENIKNASEVTLSTKLYYKSNEI
jgi:hypothetical protein